MRLLVLAHVDRDEVPLPAVERLRERQGGLGLADAARPDEQEDSDRPARVRQVRARGADAARDRLERVRLADDALLEPVLQREDGVDLVREHLSDRDPRPAGDDLRDRLRCDARLHEGRFALHLLELLVEGVELGTERGGVRRRGRGGRGSRRGGGGRGRFRPGARGLGCGLLLLRSGEVLELRTNVTDLLDQPSLLVPLRLQSDEALFRGRLAGRQLDEAVLVVGARGFLAREDLDLGSAVLDRPLRVLDRGRRCGLADRDAGAGRVEDRDGLVGKLPPRDVSVRQADGVLDGLVEDAHLVMVLERLRESAHHDDRDGLRRLLHLDDLEAAGESGVLLEVLLVLGPGGRGDRAQLAAREGGLQEVRGVVLPGLAAGADHGVRLVDEDDDRLGRGLHFFDDRLQAVLELALDSGSRLKEPEVEGPHGDVLQRAGDVSLGDAERESLHDGRLPDAGLSGEDGVVLAAAREDVDDLPDLEIPPEDRVDVAASRASRQVHGVLIQRLRPAGDARRTARHVACRRFAERRRVAVFDRARDDLVELFSESFDRDRRELLGDFTREPGELLLLEEGEEDVCGADTGGAEIDRADQPGLFDELGEAGGESRRAGVPGLEPVERSHEVLREAGFVDLEPAQDPVKVRVRRFAQLDEQMLDVDVVVRPRQAEPGGAFEGVPAGVVHSADEGFQIRAHGRFLPLLALLDGLLS